MIIIPAIDIIDGRCVRLQQGKYENVKKYDLEPVKVAEEYVEAGLTHLHLVDLDGAKQGILVNTAVLSDIARNTDLKIDCGGGIKTLGDVEMLFSLGAYAVNLGSAAVKDPDLMINCLKKYGSDKIILSADVMGNMVRIHGWQDDAHITINDLIKKFLAHGLQRVCVTAIKCDGMLQGPDIELYQKLQKEFPTLKITASGGVSGIKDLENLANNNLHSAIVGKAIYEKRVTLRELAQLTSE
ncbi:MAG: 1-(5-phosphoribosyl)-5-[Bacteroidales bacterium]|jgi:phosphoribosylformimino-5-aminoimidazole carboxamide ribotide isomerase|nr:1-(5-phosphoribosyl)-5-[(5-phosphoribosylamino)methylideneamino]imidazole-4-carboxamide isomerase [Bacteroidales bacterium]